MALLLLPDPQRDLGEERGVSQVSWSHHFLVERQPTLSNLVNSTRGVKAVMALFLLGGRADKKLWPRKLVGSALMIFALWLAIAE